MYELKEKTFSIRLTAKEYEYLQTIAAHYKMKSGAFMRWLLNKYKEEQEDTKEDEKNIF